jgi:hypothetical protein
MLLYVVAAVILTLALIFSTGLLLVSFLDHIGLCVGMPAGRRSSKLDPKLIALETQFYLAPLLGYKEAVDLLPENARLVLPNTSPDLELQFQGLLSVLAKIQGTPATCNGRPGEKVAGSLAKRTLSK